ncbi:MAG: translation initiation factor IF-2 subunit beta [Nitrososphaerota archaeon]|nr:translation initiation factor IF-2 subunit beta [Candidatus Aenigmarchaeota archaeon]
MDNEYLELLERLYQKLPKKSGTGERFEPPKVEISYIGNQTIIKNFIFIADSLRREPQHLLKFFTKETAAPGNISGKQAIFQSKIPAHIVNSKLEAYIKEFVLCKECKRPDTKIIKKDKKLFSLKCEACGAETSIRSI